MECLLSSENKSSSICIITVAYRERVVETRSEYNHRKYGIAFSVSRTFPSFCSGSTKWLYYVGVSLRVHISNIFLYLVLRVSVVHGARAPSQSSPASELFHSSLFFAFLWPYKRHSTKSTLSTSCALLCLLGLLHRNQRQSLQLHQAISPNTSTPLRGESPQTRETRAITNIGT